MNLLIVKRKNIQKSTFVKRLSLCLLPLLFQSCISSRAKFSSISVSDSIRQYKIIERPYFKKELSGFGKFFFVAATAGGAAAGYILSDQVPIDQSNPEQNKYYAAAAGAVAGYTVSRLSFIIGGNRKERTPQNHMDYLKWMNAYSNQNEINLVLIHDTLVGGDTAIWALEAAREKFFVPYNYQDVILFASAFPNSTYLDGVILTANSFLSKEELKLMIARFPENKAIEGTKKELVNKSETEEEMRAAIRHFPFTQSSSEKKYAELVRTFPYLKDFAAKYPKSDYLGAAVLNAIPQMSQKELEEVWNFNYIPNQVRRTIELSIVERCSTFKQMMKVLRIYPNTGFIVRYDESIYDIDSTKSIARRLKQYQPFLTTNGIKSVAVDVRFQYILNILNENNAEDIRQLFRELNSDVWLTEDLPQDLFDKVVLKIAEIYKSDYFVVNGKISEMSRPYGNGRHYKSNGVIRSGLFTEGRLNGWGSRIEVKDGKSDIYEGEFLNDELNGKGKHITPMGSIYEGNFRNDQLDGTGSIIFYDGTYDKGTFIRNKMEGYGERKTLKYIYKGEFKSNLYEGEGECRWLNDTNRWFKGSFSNGMRNGPGVLHTSATLFIEGTWKNDCPTGTAQFMIYSYSTKQFEQMGTWELAQCKIIKKDPENKFDAIRENLVLERIDY